MRVLSGFHNNCNTFHLLLCGIVMCWKIKFTYVANRKHSPNTQRLSLTNVLIGHFFTTILAAHQPRVYDIL